MSGCGSAPSALKIATVAGSGGVRILSPATSAGVLMGCLLFEVWRMPLSMIPSRIMPLASAFFASSSPIGPSSTFQACSDDVKR